MDIKELDKKQLILLTLLITFVVSIATGIVTVSLMNQMPKSVPQTINNVIQRTIEKVTTVEVPVYQNENQNENKDNVSDNKNGEVSFLSENEALVSIYLNNKDLTTTENEINKEEDVKTPEAIGQGVIISDVGLILVDSSLITDLDSYKVLLDKTEFSLVVLKKFNNGFTVMKITPMKVETETVDKIETPTETQ